VAIFYEKQCQIVAFKVTRTFSERDLSAVASQDGGEENRSFARTINMAVGRSGSFWQREVKC
jgi:hypothetical protein